MISFFNPFSNYLKMSKKRKMVENFKKAVVCIT